MIELCVAVAPIGGFSTSNTSCSFPLYWILNASGDHVETPKVLQRILADSLLEKVWITNSSERIAWLELWRKAGFKFFAERQFLPGVTDNLANTVKEALHLAGISKNVKVASGLGCLSVSTPIKNVPLTDRLVIHNLANPLDQLRLLGFPKVSLPKAPPVSTIDLDVSDDSLIEISRRGCLALNLSEMKTIAAYFRNKLRAPTDVELEIIAQTWSEHCKHKIFGATIHYEDKVINSLYQTYIKSATKQLAKEATGKNLLSVFKDNAGVVRFNDKWAVCFKVETHNSPSALEPYGGALTGILGVNRDILGTGVGAKPIANTDVFCFAYPSDTLPQRPNMLAPEIIIKGVRKGVEDGGNKSGIPTVNGSVYFHKGYRAKPLVFCGTIGLLPLEVAGVCAYEKHTQVGDVIVMAGGRVGKDGIHGATFSSEALHADAPISAVQIGDPFTQKRLLDFVVEARDAGLITGITDNGAGGLSSSVGEMAQLTGGATLDLDDVPLKYPGLADWEIVVSESQERMTISTKDFEALEQLALKHRVEITKIGVFDDSGSFVVRRNKATIACLELSFLHAGCPTLELTAELRPPQLKEDVGEMPSDLGSVLLELLKHPNICSREEIIRQYDHEVQGGSVVKPLMGLLQQAPCDAAVIKPLPDDPKGLVISHGICPNLSLVDARLMAQCAVDEAIRNAVCVGADPSQIYILDNFCWPDPVFSKRNVDGPHKLGQLVEVCESLYDAALAYKAPLISGKDSMKNDFDDGVVRLSIPPTLLVSAMGFMPDAEKAVTMQFKHPGDVIYLLCACKLGVAGSQYEAMNNWRSSVRADIDPNVAAKMYGILHQAIKDSLVSSCHDVSDGGLAVALAECAIGSDLGLEAFVEPIVDISLERLDFALFGEGPARLVLTVAEQNKEVFEKMWVDAGPAISCTQIGVVTHERNMRLLGQDCAERLNLDVDALVVAWKTPLMENLP